MELSWSNPLRYLVARAMERGVPEATLVMILAFPIAASLIAASRHWLGLRGFGIFIPAALAVAFVASGIGPGLVLLAVILLVATLGRIGLRGLKLQYLPRMALLLWLVSLGVLLAFVVAAEVGMNQVAAVGIFPVLILILLAENFSQVQATKSMRTAVNLTLETVVLALIAAGILSFEAVQRFVITQPEWTVVIIALADGLMGKYTGLRLTEYWRFNRLREK